MAVSVSVNAARSSRRRFGGRSTTSVVGRTSTPRWERFPTPSIPGTSTRVDGCASSAQLTPVGSVRCERPARHDGADRCAAGPPRNRRATHSASPPWRRAIHDADQCRGDPPGSSRHRTRCRDPSLRRAAHRADWPAGGRTGRGLATRSCVGRRDAGAGGLFNRCRGRLHRDTAGDRQSKGLSNARTQRSALAGRCVERPSTGSARSSLVLATGAVIEVRPAFVVAHGTRRRSAPHKSRRRPA